MGGGGTISNSAERIGSLQLQQSSYGLPVAIIYGRNRVPVNLVYYNDFVATAHTETQSAGGKGGGVKQQNTTYSYSAAVILAIGEGAITGVGAVYRDKEVLDLAGAGLSLRTGDEAQSVWPYLTATHPDQAVGYSGTAYLYAEAYELQSNASLGNHNVEVQTSWEFSGAIFDANPAAFIPDFLTHPRYGLGLAPAQLASLTDYSNYVRAAGLFLSPACTEQREGHEYLTEWAQLTNSELVWSGTQLRIVPYGDATITGNGATYTPDLSPIYDLSDDDYLESPGDDPLRIRRGDAVDSYNVRSLEYNDRANAYNKSVVTASDQASIDQFGVRRADKISTSAVCDADVASRVVQLRLQRDVYVRNHYEFSLGAWAQLLEPMDRLTLTDTRLGLDHWPVRIIETSEQDEGVIDIVAEDAPGGIGHAPLYPRGQGAGYQPNTLADPGDVAAPLIFEPPAQLSDDRLQVWVAVTGQVDAWGGCSVWVSTDGDTYQRLGTVRGGARYGALTAALSDSGSSLAVELIGKGGQMLSGATLDADLLNTLCAVGTEFVAYQDATLTGANAYTLSGLVRGAYESPAVAHADGAPFVRLDDALAKSQALSPALIGQTLYFKFTSFNVFGLAEQALDEVTPYNYEVTGQFYLAATAAAELYVAKTASSAALEVVPVGTPIPWAFGTSPGAKYLAMDGATYAVDDYPELGALYGGAAGGSFAIADWSDVPVWGAGGGAVGTIVGGDTLDIRHDHAAGGLATEAHDHGAGSLVSAAHDHTTTETTVNVTPAIIGGTAVHNISAINNSGPHAVSGSTDSNSGLSISGSTAGASYPAIADPSAVDKRPKRALVRWYQRALK